jgi:hypothetical protein
MNYYQKKMSMKSLEELISLLKASKEHKVWLDQDETIALNDEIAKRNLTDEQKRMVEDPIKYAPNPENLRNDPQSGKGNELPSCGIIAAWVIIFSIIGLGIGIFIANRHQGSDYLDYSVNYAISGLIIGGIVGILGASFLKQ